MDQPFLFNPTLNRVRNKGTGCCFMLCFKCGYSPAYLTRRIILLWSLGIKTIKLVIYLDLLENEKASLCWAGIAMTTLFELSADVVVVGNQYFT